VQREEETGSKVRKCFTFRLAFKTVTPSWPLQKRGGIRQCRFCFQETFDINREDVLPELVSEYFKKSQSGLKHLMLDKEWIEITKDNLVECTVLFS
jgi:hypothetical protein